MKDYRLIQELKSKLIDGVVYSMETRRLTLHMSNGHRREYVEVPASVYEALLAAKSAGKFYMENIKPNFELAE